MTAPGADAMTDARDARPFPPGEYAIVVVGSGPGALQVGYFLSRLGIEHAILSSDPGPGAGCLG